MRDLHARFSHCIESVLKLLHVLWTIAGRNIFLDTIGAYYVNGFDALEAYTRFSKHSRTSRCSTPDNARLLVSFGFVKIFIAPGVVVKGDYQFRDNSSDSDNVDDRLNLGIGVWF